MNYFKLPIVTVPGRKIEPICVRNAVTGNPHYYHSKRAKKGPNYVLLITVQRGNRHSVLRTEVIKHKGGQEAFLQWTFRVTIFCSRTPQSITAADYSIH